MQMGALVLKTFLGAALEAEVISLDVLNLSGWSQRHTMAPSTE